MSQKDSWEREYRNLKLISLENKPHSEIVRLLKQLKKKFSFSIEGKKIIDIGCGTGRNAFYFSELGASVLGIDIAPTAITIAKQRAVENGQSISYILGDISEKFLAENQSVDLIIDILASNSLNHNERTNYLTEVHRVLKPGGFFYVRALAKEGDANAAALLKLYPGREKNTYVIKQLNLTETIFTKEDLLEIYGKFFEIITFEKKAHYPSIDGRVYKRQFYYVLFRKPL